MSCRKWLAALAVASVIGGLFFTVLSGLYAVKPYITDAEVVYFGFPFPWLIAWRSAWKGQMSWVYRFLWRGFIVDSAVYGLFVAATLGMYFISLSKKCAHGEKSRTFLPAQAPRPLTPAPFKSLKVRAQILTVFFCWFFHKS